MTWQQKRPERRAPESVRLRRRPQPLSDRSAPGRDPVRSEPRKPDLAADLTEQVRQTKLTARMNCLYYEATLRTLEQWDLFMRLTAGLVASAGVAGAVKASGSVALVSSVGAVAGVLGVVSPILGLPARIKNCAAILPKYVALANRCERALVAGPISTKTALAVMDALAKIEVTEADKVRYRNDKRMEEARVAACEEAGLDPNA